MINQARKKLHENRSEQFNLSNSEKSDFSFTQYFQPLDYPLLEHQDFAYIGYLSILKSSEQTQQFDSTQPLNKYGILGSLLVKFKSLDSLEIEESLDVTLSAFKQLEFSDNESYPYQQISGFQLKKYYQTIQFITQDKSVIQKWELAFGNFIINEHIERHYEIQKVLGQGAHGQVYLGSLLNNKNQEGVDQRQNRVAIKSINKKRISHNKQLIQNTINEIKIHQSLARCENILQLLAIYENEQEIQLVLEFQKYGSLLDPISEQVKLTEVQIKSIMEQLLLALDFFHKKKIIHRDIKLDNILINQIEGDQYDVRVADFGIAQQIPNDDLLFHKCGTPGYCAPEILRGVGYDYRADIFSLGLVFYNLVTGRNIFVANDVNEVLKMNTVCNYKHIFVHIESSGLSKQGKDLLIRMLSTNRKTRPTARQALEHSWFKNDESIIQELLAVNEQIATATCDEVNKKSFSSFYNAGVGAGPLHYVPNSNNSLIINKIKDNAPSSKSLSPLNRLLANQRSNSSNGSSNSQNVNYFTALRLSQTKLVRCSNEQINQKSQNEIEQSKSQFFLLNMRKQSIQPNLLLKRASKESNQQIPQGLYKNKSQIVQRQRKSQSQELVVQDEDVHISISKLQNQGSQYSDSDQDYEDYGDILSENTSWVLQPTHQIPTQMKLSLKNNPQIYRTLI